MSYEINIDRKVIKFLNNFKEASQKDFLTIDIFISKFLKNAKNPTTLPNAEKLIGFNDNQWCWWLGDYRIIGTVINEQVCIIKIFKIARAQAVEIKPETAKQDTQTQIEAIKEEVIDAEVEKECLKDEIAEKQSAQTQIKYLFPIINTTQTKQNKADYAYIERLKSKSLNQLFRQGNTTSAAILKIQREIKTLNKKLEKNIQKENCINYVYFKKLKTMLDAKE